MFLPAHRRRRIQRVTQTPSSYRAKMNRALRAQERLL